MKKQNLLAVVVPLLALCSCRQEAVSIIPVPVKTETHSGRFTVNKHTKIYSSPEFAPRAGIIADILRRSTGYELPVVATDEHSGRGIHFVLSDGAEIRESEGYTLTVTRSNVIVESTDAAGLFNGAQTLRQLLPSGIESSGVVRGVAWRIPCVSVADYPRYPWRGYMKDVSRTFFGVDVMKKYIDVMSLYKVNVLHLHLSDDQGWRVEIMKHPKLTEPLSTVFPEKLDDRAERSGFYTQEQIRNLVRYAAERNVTIVPEIDVPGHSWAALLAYPELGVSDKLEPHYLFPFLDSWSYWGVQFTPNTLDPTSERVYEFLDDVFTEIAGLFPGEYIHFGGDEAKHFIWEAEPHVRQFMKARGMNSTSDLQSYFASRVCGIIKSKGRKPIGWNDILRDSKNLGKDVAVMSWLGEQAIKQAAEHGIYTVATPATHLYMDVTQADRNDGTMTDLAYEMINSVERIYGYEPTESLLPEEEKYVLGIQANLWTHIARSVKDVNVQIFPRLLALSEIAWMPKGERDLQDFEKRLERHYGRLDLLNVDYFRPGGYITGVWSPAELTGGGYRPVEWDVTRKVYANGRVVAGFYHTGGKSFMNIRKVELLENGNIVSSDEHEGLADDFRATHKVKTYLYNLSVDNYDPDAGYTLRAEVAGADSADSHGNMTFNLSPNEPFTVIEPK